MTHVPPAPIAARSSARVEPLRRADGRFLLPHPLDEPFGHLVLLGGPDDLPDELTRTGIAERVTRGVPPERSADAVIALDASVGSLRRAVATLRPGGSVYCEFDRRSPASIARSPGRVRRSVEKAGLSVTGVYWLRPNLTERQVFVPLHACGPLRWYLGSILTASSPAAWALEVVLRSLERLGSRTFAAFAPCYGLTAVAGPASEGAPSIIGLESLPPHVRRLDPDILVVTQGKEDFKRLTILPFPASEERPSAVLKAARLSEHSAATLAEQEVLGTIRAALDDDMRETVPEPLGVVMCGGIPIGIESVAEGRSIASKVSRWGAPLGRKIDELHRAAAWITEFNRSVQIETSGWETQDLGIWIDEPFAAYERAFGITSGEERLFQRTRETARALIGLPLPTVWVHWDFSEHNVYSSDTRLTVLDWERAAAGPPLLDLLFFGTIWSFSARGMNTVPTRLRGFRHLFRDPRRTDPVCAAVHQVFDRYMAALGIDERFLPLLLVVVCVKRALIHLGRRQPDAEPSAALREGNPYVDWLDALVEEA